MGMLVLAPAHDAAGKHDASGAFIPESRAFARIHGCVAQTFDNQLNYSARRKYILELIRSLPPASISAVALFCHGWRDGIQLGFRLGEAAELAGALAPALYPFPVIALYACDAGRDGDDDRADDTAPGPGGDGGFADALRDAFGKLRTSAYVYAHSVQGHCSFNSYVRVFAPGSTVGGEWLVEPKSELWPVWRKALHGNLRFQFPFLSRELLEHELRMYAQANA